MFTCATESNNNHSISNYRANKMMLYVDMLHSSMKNAMAGLSSQSNSVASFTQDKSQQEVVAIKLVARLILLLYIQLHIKIKLLYLASLNSML